MIEPLRAANLSSVDGLRHGFFTRQGGVSEGVYASLNCSAFAGDDPAKVAANRALVAEAMGVPADHLLSLNQVHGAGVITVSATWEPMAAPEADAMVTSCKGIALGILTADCVPVLLAEPEAGVIAALHAGWRSAYAGVIEASLLAMESLGASREKIQAAIGPCIWQDSYEVDRAFMDQFLEQDLQNNRFFCESEREDHFLFELPAYVRDKLKRAEIAGLSLSPADTYADEARFFSYRRAGLRRADQTSTPVKTGRQISAIAMVG